MTYAVGDIVTYGHKNRGLGATLPDHLGQQATVIVVRLLSSTNWWVEIEFADGVRHKTVSTWVQPMDRGGPW